MQPTSGVDNDGIQAPGACGVDGVEGDGSRVTPRSSGDAGKVEAVGPDLKLRNGAGAIGVRGSEKDFSTLALKPPAQLRCRGRLAGSINPNEQDDGGTGLCPRDGPSVIGTVLQQLGQALLERALQVGFRLDLSPAYFVFQSLSQLDSARHSEVGLDEHPFQVLEVVGIQTAHQRANIGEREALDPRPHTGLFRGQPIGSHDSIRERRFGNLPRHRSPSRRRTSHSPDKPRMQSPNSQSQSLAAVRPGARVTRAAWGARVTGWGRSSSESSSTAMVPPPPRPSR